MKTLIQCKNEVARQHYNNSWDELCKLGNHNGTPDKWFDEAAELYASQFREPSSPTVKESETGEQEEMILEILENFQDYLKDQELNENVRDIKQFAKEELERFTIIKQSGECGKEIGRLLASKEHKEPFYFDGEMFTNLSGTLRFDKIRSNGDYFIKPTFVKI